MADLDQAKQKMIDNLKEKTGKTLPQWQKVVKATGLDKHGEIVKLLKAEHGVTHGFANLIAHEARAAQAGGAPTGDDLVAAQYSGNKAELRPIYEAVLKAVKALGKDVEIAPKKTSVSFRRNKQFALATPATRTRVDVGIQLKGVKATGRLKAAGGMTSHKVGVTSPKEVDAELKGWLKQAYEAAG